LRRFYRDHHGSAHQPVPVRRLAAEGSRRRRQLQGEWLLLSTTDMRRQEDGSPSIRMEIAEDGRLIYRLNQLVTNRGAIKVSAGGSCSTSI